MFLRTGHRLIWMGSYLKSWNDTDKIGNHDIPWWFWVDVQEVISNYQCRVRRDRSTADQILNGRLILQEGRKIKVHTYHLFIDLKSAYVKIKRSELFVVMKESGFERKLIRLVAMTLNRLKNRIKWVTKFPTRLLCDQSP